MAISSKGNSKEMQGVKTWDLRVGDHVRVADHDDILEVIEIKDPGYTSFSVGSEVEYVVRMRDGRSLYWNNEMFDCCGRTGKIIDVDCVSGSFGKLLLKDDEPDGELNDWVLCSTVLRKIP